MEIYKSLKKEWITFNQAWDKYGDTLKTDKFRFINRVAEADKEQIGRAWVVRESGFKKAAQSFIKENSK